MYMPVRSFINDIHDCNQEFNFLSVNSRILFIDLSQVAVCLYSVVSSYLIKVQTPAKMLTQICILTQIWQSQLPSDLACSHHTVWHPEHREQAQKETEEQYVFHFGKTDAHQHTEIVIHLAFKTNAKNKITLSVDTQLAHTDCLLYRKYSWFPVYTPKKRLFLRRVEQTWVQRIWCF